MNEYLLAAAKACSTLCRQVYFTKDGPPDGPVDEAFLYPLPSMTKQQTRMHATNRLLCLTRVWRQSMAK
eukprot:682409-Amphidinium_carterae.1